MNPSPTDITRMIEALLGHSPIEFEAPLIETYGAESADIANIVTALEKRYGVHIPETTLPQLRAARDFYDFLQQA